MRYVPPGTHTMSGKGAGPGGAIGEPSSGCGAGSRTAGPRAAVSVIESVPSAPTRDGQTKSQVPTHQSTLLRLASSGLVDQGVLVVMHAPLGSDVMLDCC